VAQARDVQVKQPLTPGARREIVPGKEDFPGRLAEKFLGAPLSLSALHEPIFGTLIGLPDAVAASEPLFGQEPYT
jgi:hypothetical protein